MSYGSPNVQVVAHRLADDRAVVGMDERLDLAVRVAVAGRVAEHLAEARRIPDLAGAQIELEQRVLRAGHGALEALLRLAQLGRLARDLLLRQLLVGRVPVDAEHADRVALGIAQDAGVALDVADAAVDEQGAVAVREQLIPAVEHLPEVRLPALAIVRVHELGGVLGALELARARRAAR